METLANRNNNPGNLRDETTGQFRVFNSPQEGYAALLNDIQIKKNGQSKTSIQPTDTIADFAKVYAPQSENDSAQYAANLANHLGTSPATQIKDVDTAKLAEAITNAEGYKSQQSSGFVNPNQKPSTSNFVTPPQSQPVKNIPNVEQPSLMSKLISGAKDIGKSIEAPFVSLAALPVQGVAKVLGQKDPYADFSKETGLAPVTSSDQPLGQFAEKELGNAAQVGSYFVPGKGILGAAGMGALQGGGSAMSQGQDLGSVLGNTAIGAGTGALVGGATKLAGKALSAIGENFSGKAAQKAGEEIKNAYATALNLNASERAFENRSGKDIAQVLLENKAPLGKYPDGTLDATAAIEKLKNVLDPLNQQAKQILSKPQGVVKTIPFTEVFNDVKNRIESSKLPTSETKQMTKQLTSFLTDEVKKYGNDMTPEIADQIKQNFQNSVFKKAITPEGVLTNNVKYYISDALKDHTEKAVAGTDAGDVLGKLNKKRSDLLDAIKRLTTKNGVTKLKGGQLGNMMGGLVGSIAGGATGNPLLALGGDYFGSKAMEFLNNPATQIGKAEFTQKAKGIIPGILGKTAQPIGNAVTSVGNIVQKGARPAGLIGNLLINSKR